MIVPAKRTGAKEEKVFINADNILTIDSLGIARMSFTVEKFQLDRDAIAVLASDFVLMKEKYNLCTVEDKMAEAERNGVS